MKKRLTAALMAAVMCFSVIGSGMFVRAEEIEPALTGEVLDEDAGDFTDGQVDESCFAKADPAETGTVDADVSESEEDINETEFYQDDEDDEESGGEGAEQDTDVTDEFPEADRNELYAGDDNELPAGPEEAVDVLSARVAVSERPADGVTYGQPFASGTGGSENYRIPAIVTLSDGTLVAAADAEWNHGLDGCNIDTVVSRSSDNGATWHYSFVNYLGDCGNEYNTSATAFIDPALATDGSTVWMLIDLYPGGVEINSSKVGTGYDDNGHLILSTDGCKTFGYYLGDFGSDGFAGIYSADGVREEGFTVDRWFNLYENGKEISNLFFIDCDYKVFQTSYLYLVKSTDGGRTWGAPLMINDQVKSKSYKFYGVGPGRGLVTSTGRIMFACYNFTFTDGATSVIYSDDGGETWSVGNYVKEQTSEATMVEINGKIYMFTRHGGYYVSDDYGETWGPRQPVGTDYNTGCQLDAIVYSKTINGRKAILLSAAGNTGSRSDGKIFVGLVMDDGSISWDYSYSITEPGAFFAYSCMTEMDNGDIALLYENEAASIRFETIPISDIADGGEIGGPLRIRVPLYGSLTVVNSSLAAWEPDTDMVSVTKDGNYVTLRGLSEGTHTITVGDDTIIIEVVADEVVEISLPVGESAEIMVNGADFCQEPDESVATAVFDTYTVFDYFGCQSGSLAVNAGNSLETGDVYYGDVVPLDKALYTFDRNDDGSYTVHAETADGNTVYLSYRPSAPRHPNDTENSGKVEVIENNGMFQLYITNVNLNEHRYLYFYQSGNNYFDVYSFPIGDSTSFYIYRPAKEGEESSDELYGYLSLTSADEIIDGERYLIVAHCFRGGEDHYYALYPSAKNTSDEHVTSHVIRVNNNTETINVLKMTGISSGTTDVCVGGVVYRITVTDIQEPGELVPAEPIPGELVPAEPVPGELVPAEPIPGELVPAQPVNPDGSGAVVPVTGNGSGNKTENSGNTTVNNKGGSSETGDMVHPAAAAMLICLSGAGLAVLVLTGRKKRSVR